MFLLVEEDFVHKCLVLKHVLVNVAHSSAAFLDEFLLDSEFVSIEDRMEIFIFNVPFDRFNFANGLSLLFYLALPSLF